jgi:hypothetical protein
VNLQHEWERIAHAATLTPEALKARAEGRLAPEERRERDRLRQERVNERKRRAYHADPLKDRLRRQLARQRRKAEQETNRTGG